MGFVANNDTCTTCRGVGKVHRRVAPGRFGTFGLKPPGKTVNCKGQATIFCPDCGRGHEQ